MKRFQITVLIILMICAICPLKTTAGAGRNWTIQEIIDVGRAHSAQVEDLQYAYNYQLIPQADPNYIADYEVLVMSVPGKNWQKRITKKQVSTSPGEVYQTVNAWDGQYNRYNIAHFGQGREASRKEGIISSRKSDFSGRDPLTFLGIRGSMQVNLPTFLNGEDVLAEGASILDGYETIVISINRIPDLSRKDSLIMKCWLDMNKGALPRRAEMYYKEELKRVTSDVTLSEIKPGLFFPTSCTVTTFAREGQDIWSQGATMWMQVDDKSIKINQGLQKEDFNVEFEHGQPVWDEDLGMQYYEGIGLYDDEVGPVTPETALSPEQLLDILDGLVDETFDAIDSEESEQTEPAPSEANAQ